MRKLLFILVLITLPLAGTAQENDPWVGTWTSESYRDWDPDNQNNSDELVYTDYKLIIRITKNGDSYNVRAKTLKVKDPSYSFYHDPFTVKRLAGNSMWLESYAKKVPFTVDYGYGPKIDSYSDNTYYYKLTLNNGVLHYSYYKVYSVEYDPNMRYRKEETLNTRDIRSSELNLYNDDW